MCITDEQIVASFQSTSSNCDFEELVARHLGRVRDFAYRMILCSSTADDIAQEVFLRVFRNLHTFRSDSKFTTWLYRITVNTVREYKRKQASNRELSQIEVEASVHNYERPDRLAMDGELAASIGQALATLSDKLRVAIVLTVMEGVEVKEVAGIEGCSVSTIHWRIHQARKELKRILSSHLQS